jgi:hypothetical protein
MDFFRSSKKTSEAGIWIADEEVKNCMICKASFGLFKRRHHCRQCGAVCCGECSSNRKFLESSRSGAPKRVCDTCFDKDRGRAAQDDEEEEDEEDSRGASSRASGGSSAKSAEALPAAPMPIISVEEGVQALKDHPLEGAWVFTIKFNVVDIGLQRAGAPAVPGMDLSTYNKSGRNKEGGASVRAGSVVDIKSILALKGGSYFFGSCPSFCQFGKDGKVNGALQRTTGKVNMTIQMTNTSKVTTSFNFTGMINHEGTYMGTFSGCEISKSAGSVSGTFTAVRTADSDGEEAVAALKAQTAAKDAVKDDDDEDSDD